MRLRRWNDLRGPYKAEIFSRDYEFRSVAVIREPSLQEDYLTLEGTSVTAPAILAKKGDYAVITELTGAPVYQGIVSDLFCPCSMSQCPMTGRRSRPGRWRTSWLG